MRSKNRGKTEPKLCPSCPFGHAWRMEARKRLMDKQWSKQKEAPGNRKVCAEMRAMARERGVEMCEFYPRNEDMAIYVGMETKERIVVKKRMDEYAR